jgi:hypothetical protein
MQYIISLIEKYHYLFFSAQSDFLLMINTLSELINEIHNNEIILFGDSIMSFTDNKKILFDDVLQKYINTNIVSFHGGAYSFLLYTNILDIFPSYTTTKKNTRKIIMIPVNMRTFSDEWFIRPSYSFMQVNPSVKYIAGESIIEQFIDYFEYQYSNILLSQTEEYNNTVSCVNIVKNDNTIMEIYDRLKLLEGSENIGASFKFYYCYPSHILNERSMKLIETGKKIKNKGYIPIFYITPINYELIKYNDYFLFENNVNLLKNILKLNKFYVIDMSIFLEQKFFTECEHLTANGIIKVVQKLAENIKVKTLEKSLLKRINTMSIRAIDTNDPRLTYIIRKSDI